MITIYVAYSKIHGEDKLRAFYCLSDLLKWISLASPSYEDWLLFECKTEEFVKLPAGVDSNEVRMYSITPWKYPGRDGLFGYIEYQIYGYELEYFEANIDDGNFALDYKVKPHSGCPDDSTVVCTHADIVRKLW